MRWALPVPVAMLELPQAGGGDQVGLLILFQQSIRLNDLRGSRAQSLPMVHLMQRGRSLQVACLALHAFSRAAVGSVVTVTTADGWD